MADQWNLSSSPRLSENILLMDGSVIIPFQRKTKEPVDVVFEFPGRWNKGQRFSVKPKYKIIMLMYRVCVCVCGCICVYSCVSIGMSICAWMLSIPVTCV